MWLPFGNSKCISPTRPSPVYRHQLKPVITKDAETMNTIFTEHAETKSA